MRETRVVSRAQGPCHEDVWESSLAFSRARAWPKDLTVTGGPSQWRKLLALLLRGRLRQSGQSVRQKGPFGSGPFPRRLSSGIGTSPPVSSHVVDARRAAVLTSCQQLSPPSAFRCAAHAAVLRLLAIVRKSDAAQQSSGDGGRVRVWKSPGIPKSPRASNRGTMPQLGAVLTRAPPRSAFGLRSCHLSLIL